MTRPKICVVGRIELTRQCIEALHETGVKIGLVVGWGGAFNHISGGVRMDGVCEKLRIPLYKTIDINAPETVEAIRKSKCALLVVTGWSQLLKPEALGVCPLGTIGLHPTRLPEGRGRAPIPWTILKRLKTSAVTLFYLTPGVDDGDIIAQCELPLLHNNATMGELLGYNADLLYDEVCEASKRLLVAHVPDVLAGKAPRIPQDHAKATYWKRRRQRDGAIRWTKSAADIVLMVDATTHPFPGAFCKHPDGGSIKVWRAFTDRLTNIPKDPLPGGTVERVTEDMHHLVVACGKKGTDRVHLATFTPPKGNRRRIQPGERLG